MEINTEKTKVLTNNVEGIRGDIRINDKRLEIVNHLKSLSGIVTDEGTKTEIQSRIVEATHEISQLKIIWKDKNTSLQTKIRLIHIPLLSIFSMNLKHGPSLMICKKEYRSEDEATFKAPLNSHTKTMLKLTKGNAGLRQLLDLMKICVLLSKGVR